MSTKSSIDPLAEQVARFVIDTYGPKFVKIVRRNLSMKAVGWIALTGALIVVPFAVAAVLKSNGERASDKRYDTADYLSDDLS